MKRGRGRPKEENTRDYILNFRFDNKDMYRLNNIIEATGDSKSDIIRIALRGYFMYLKEMEKLSTDEIKRKRGRPKKEELRYDKHFRFNGTEDHEYMRKALEEKMSKNGGEVMREALELLYNMKIGWDN